MEVEPRPVIGLITQVQERLAESDSLAVPTNQQYLRAIASAGATTRRIPLLHHDEQNLRACYEQIDGLCLTGGADVSPVHYGEECHPRCEPADPARDLTELLLFRWARQDGKPILGICRGMQLINVAAGGTLYQDLASQRPQGSKHDYFSTVGSHPRHLLVHDVRVDAASQLGRILGLEEVRVNSMHHQAVRDLAPGLTATAFAPDGLIEGIEAADGQFVIGVQWHPEELTDNVPVMRRLFGALSETADEYLVRRGRHRLARR
jgi:putative glutamine amidotransferase